PIWITEFAEQALNAASVAQHADLMVDAIDYMETDPMIFRYAWFMARSSPSTNTQDILGQTTGTYTNLGLIYTHMSSYDNNYYHTVNNIIEAEYYIDKSVIYYNCTTPCAPFCANTCWWYSVLLENTTDGAGGILDVYNFNSTNDTVYYNINIPATQTYSIDFRVNSTAASTLLIHNAAGTVLGTTPSLNTSGTWSTINLSSVNLVAGKQKIYLTATNGAPLKLNWMKINCSSNCSLPVDLISFDASKLSSNSVKLEWNTASEKDNKIFVLERSADGIVFDSIGSIEGKGTTDRMNQYFYIDTNPFTTLNYYRIKIVDNNGNYTYSSLSEISFEENKITLAENTIISRLVSESTIYYVVLNSIGQLVQEGNYAAREGVTEKEILLNNLSKGIYLIKIVSGDDMYSGKIINR
ncbi:MAG TPA: carbohydrate-binding protein, partial [Cytophagaceae bacterium]|nr:carbohydrate-binding protein [Cytophagaceae bacterium]